MEGPWLSVFLSEIFCVNILSSINNRISKCLFKMALFFGAGIYIGQNVRRHIRVNQRSFPDGSLISDLAVNGQGIDSGSRSSVLNEGTAHLGDFLFS